MRRRFAAFWAENTEDLWLKTLLRMAENDAANCRYYVEVDAVEENPTLDATVWGWFEA